MSATEPLPEVRRDRLIYRWDLDKTYLRTQFDTVRDWVRIAFEKAHDKRTIPGAAALLRELRATGPRGIFIVSGSPTQLRKVLEAKLRLDGVAWDGLVLKPQLRNILRGRFRFIKDQVGYKLAALFESRAGIEPDVQEYLFGDDAELDASIYSLYSDVCTGRTSLEVLREVLERSGAYDDVVPAVVALAEKVPKGGGAIRMFIHLERVSPPLDFAALGSRVVPFHNYLQPALVLLEEGAIDPHAAVRVAAELLGAHGFTADALVASYFDLGRRGHLGGRGARALVAFIEEHDDRTLGVADAPQLRAFARGLVAEGATALPEAVPPTPPHLDYVEHFGKDKARAKAAKRRAMGR